jgi:formamidopyrimidine-DNA glycosylase
LPELPEVETLKNSLAPLLEHGVIKKLHIYNKNLRWPVSPDLKKIIGQSIQEIQRRGKYLIFILDHGFMIIHLGMSGTLVFREKSNPKEKHDHIQFKVGKYTLFYNDPRRFGSIHYAKELDKFALLKNLGVEPLSSTFNGDYLYSKTRLRRTSIKQIIMNAKIVTGIGNIYASESLFMSKVRPTKKASRLTKAQCNLLVLSIKKVLNKAIKAGGSSLLNFKDSSGKPGYFSLEHLVYGRGGLACYSCNKLIKKRVITGRSSFYCAHCQS